MSIVLAIYNLLLILSIGVFVGLSILDLFDILDFEIPNAVKTILSIIIAVLSFTGIFLQFMAEEYFYAFSCILFSAFWAFVAYKNVQSSLNDNS